jgi:ring-1,2-phenylacetyl-CoA epoxidase subunit PaaE
MAAGQFHNLEITAIRKPSGGSTALSFEIPIHLKETFAFIPGQYLTLRTDIAGEDLRRSYSICSARSSEHLEVGIKQVQEGRFSNHILTLNVGDTLQVMAPQGRFTAQINSRKTVSHTYLLLASGSGITPCLSIAKSVLEEEANSAITLVYGNRSTASAMFLDDIVALKDRFTARFQIIYTFSREQSDTPLFNRRLDGAMLDILIENGLVDVRQHDAAYVCGPHGMIVDMEARLEAAGLARANIRHEHFGTPQSPARPSGAAVPKSRTGTEVAILLDGKQSTFAIADPDQTVLFAAQAAGIELPFSCAGGMCCTCRCKIVSGETIMAVNYALQDWEIKAGFTLACQSRVLSDHLVLDFDAT